MNRFCLAVACLLTVAGCISNKELKEKYGLEASASRLVTCQAGVDCDEKWVRAEQWIRTNAAYQITTQSDSLIETAGPAGLDDRLGFTVTKKLIKPPIPPVSAVAPTLPPAAPAKDTYDIAFFTRCNNWFGCTPSQLRAKADFTNFVIGPPAAAKPVLGVKVAPLTPEMTKKMKFSGVQGLAVMAIVPHSVAEKSGLSEGDIILRYDGTPVTTEDALTKLVSNTQPGRQVTLDIIRGMKDQTITVTF